MRSVTEKMDHKLGIRLSNRQRRRLEQLAIETQSTPSDVLRTLIDTAQTRPFVQRTVVAGNLQPTDEGDEDDLQNAEGTEQASRQAGAL